MFAQGFLPSSLAAGIAAADFSQALIDAPTVNWNIAAGTVASLTIAASRTMAAPANLRVGAFVLILTQGGSGNCNVNWNPVFKWAAGAPPALSTTVGAKDVISFVCDGASLYGSYLRGVA